MQEVIIKCYSTQEIDLKRPNTLLKVKSFYLEGTRGVMLMLFIEVITNGASALIERARMVFLLGAKCHASDILKE